MKSIKEKNKENNVKSSMKIAHVIAVLAGAAVILSGCGNSQGSSTSSGIGNTAATEAASAAEETSAAATEAETAEETSAAATEAAETSEDTTAADTADASAPAETTADDTSSTSAPSDEEDNSSETADDSGQNPMMNYIGNYVNGSATMNVSCIGKDKASITITKENSKEDGFSWSMSGPVSVGDESITVSYDNCTKKFLEYSDNGDVKCIITEYENGSGTVEFLFSDNNAYWHDGVDGVYADSAFTFSN